MPIPESKRRNNDIYNAKCDRISARPVKPVGNAIRAAAKAAGQSVQAYVLQACAERMTRRASRSRSTRPPITNKPPMITKPAVPITKTAAKRTPPRQAATNSPPGCFLCHSQIVFPRAIRSRRKQSLRTRFH